MPASGKGWIALSVWLAAFAVVALLANLVQPIVDAAIFGLGDSVEAPKKNLSLWLGQLGIAVLLYLIAEGLRALGTTAIRSEWFLRLQQLLRFLILLSWVVVLYLGELAVRVQDEPSSILAVDFELLLVATLVAVLAPICFHLNPAAAIGRCLFFLALIVFYGALVALEPDQLLARLVALGLAEPPMDWVLSSSFLGPVRYLAPVAPVLWAAFAPPQAQKPL